MKVATVVFALLVTCGSAYADPNGGGGGGGNGNDKPPIDQTAAPVPLVSAPPVRTAEPCTGGGCKSKDTPPADGTAATLPLVLPLPTAVMPR